jgi:hypothetical protein
MLVALLGRTGPLGNHSKKRYKLSKVKTIPVQVCYWLRGFQEVEMLRFCDNKSYVPIAFTLPLLPENIPGIHFCQWLSRTQSQHAAGRIT